MSKPQTRHSIAIPEAAYESILEIAAGARWEMSLSETLEMVLGDPAEWRRALPRIPKHKPGGRRLHHTVIMCRMTTERCPHPFFWRGEKRCACAPGLLAGRKGDRMPMRA